MLRVVRDVTNSLYRTQAERNQFCFGVALPSVCLFPRVRFSFSLSLSHSRSHTLSVCVFLLLYVVLQEAPHSTRVFSLLSIDLWADYVVLLVPSSSTCSLSPSLSSFLSLGDYPVAVVHGARKLGT